MKKRRGHSLIEQLEQRRLLSSGQIYASSPPEAPLPSSGDLGIDSVSVAGTPEVGGSLNIITDVVEDSGMISTYFTVNITLSSDNILGNDDDVPLLQFTGQGEYGGHQENDVTIPSDISPGDYYILVNVNPGLPGQSPPLFNFPSDTNPSDDVFDTGPIFIAASGQGTPLPKDLGVVDGSFPASAGAGTFIDVVPQVLTTSATPGVGSTVNVALSTDDVWGNSDDILLTSPDAIPSNNSYQDFSQPFGSGEVQIPATAPPGNYQVLMQVEPYPIPAPGSPPDANPGNDLLDAGEISITPYAAPDVSVSAANFPATFPAGGGNIDVEPTVIRAGALANVDYYVEAALSASGVWGNVDNIALNPLSTDFVAYHRLFDGGEVSIPNSAAPGTYQLLVKVFDVLGSFDNYLPADSNSTDDMLDAGSITITPNDSSDLAITGAQAPTTASLGANVDMEPQVTRTGLLQNDPYAVNIALSSSGVWGDPDNIILQSSMESLSVAIPTNIAVGTYQLLFEVELAPPDVGSTTMLPADTDPNDNVFNAGPITITPYVDPDIGISSATLSSTSIYQDSELVVEPTLIRTGAMTDADYQFTVHLSTDSIWGNSDDIVCFPDNDPKGSLVDVLALPGQYQVLVEVAAVGEAFNPPVPTDSNPNDNEVDAGTLTILAPDDAVTGASFPSTAQAGTSIDVEPKIEQLGDLIMFDYNISVALSTDSTWGNSDDIMLSPTISGQLFDGGEVAIPSGVTAGTYQLLAHITPVDQVEPSIIFPPDGDPSDDSVDAGTITITAAQSSPVVPSQPASDDLGVTGASFPTSAAGGTNIDVEPTIIRTGGFANSDYTITVALSTDSVWGNSDDVVLSSPPVDGVYTSGESFHSGNLVIPSDMPAGTYQVLVHIGPFTSLPIANGSTPTDTDPADDEVDAGTITIVPSDLGISSATFPSTAAAGSSIDIEPTIIRTGDFDNFDYYVDAVLSKDSSYGDSDDIALSQGNLSFQSGSLTIPSTVTPGNYQLILQISSIINTSTMGDNLAPTDADPGDNIFDAGTITVTAASSSPPTSGPTNPVLTSPPTTQQSVSVSGSITSLQSVAAVDSVIAVTSMITGSFSSISYVLSPNEVFGDSDDIPLSYDGTDLGSDNTLSSMPASGILYLNGTPAGKYYVFLEVDGQSFEGPQLTVVDAMETVETNQPVTFPNDGAKYSALYLSTDDQLDITPPAPRALLKAGAKIGTPDTKLQLGKNLITTIPNGTQQGAYQLLAISKNNSQITDLGTIVVDPSANPALSLQATVQPQGAMAKRGKSGSVKLTFRNIGATPEDGVPMALYLSQDTNYSSDDVQLDASDLSPITLAPGKSVSEAYATEYPTSLAAGKYYILLCADLDNAVMMIGVSTKAVRVS
jgi:hypothetical protein